MNTKTHKRIQKKHHSKKILSAKAKLTHTSTRHKSSPVITVPPASSTTQEGDSDDDFLNEVDTKWERAITMPPAIGAPEKSIGGRGGWWCGSLRFVVFFWGMNLFLTIS